jgi:hypothetical protein
MVGREAPIKARPYGQPASKKSMRENANAAAAFCSDSTGAQEPRSVSGVAEDRGCRCSNAHRLPWFQRAANYFIRNPQSYLCRIFYGQRVWKEYFSSADGPSEEMGKGPSSDSIAAPRKMRKILTIFLQDV